MNTITAVVLLALAFAGLVVYLTRNRMSQDESIMRHTIEVNLRILRSDISALTPLIPEKARSQSQQEAFDELCQASSGADQALNMLPVASEKDLGAILSTVFEAMDRSTKARRLLDACRPLF